MAIDPAIEEDVILISEFAGSQQTEFLRLEGVFGWFFIGYCCDFFYGFWVVLPGFEGEGLRFFAENDRETRSAFCAFVFLQMAVSWVLRSFDAQHLVQNDDFLTVAISTCDVWNWRHATST